MDDIGSSFGAAAAATPRRTPVVHVHATPAGAVAEMDARCRRWTEWLMASRRDADAVGREAPPIGTGTASRGDGAHP